MAPSTQTPQGEKSRGADPPSRAAIGPSTAIQRNTSPSSASGSCRLMPQVSAPLRSIAARQQARKTAAASPLCRASDRRRMAATSSATSSAATGLVSSCELMVMSRSICATRSGAGCAALIMLASFIPVFPA